MTEIHNFSTHLFIHRLSADRTGTPSTLATDSAGSSAPAKQTVQDTVMLSMGSPKVVILARGQELNAEIQVIPVSKNFATTLLKAQEEISKIIRLLTETTKTVFLE